MKLWTPQQQPLWTPQLQQRQLMSFNRAACCCGCPVSSRTVTLSGVNAGMCTSCEPYAAFESRIITALDVDGTYELDSTGGAGGVCGWSKQFTVTGVAFDVYVSPGACAVLLRSEPAVNLEVSLTLNYNFLSGGGQPRIDNMSAVFTDTGAFAAFYYVRSTCGDDYYHGDSVPQNGSGGALCDGSGCAGFAGPTASTAGSAVSST